MKTCSGEKKASQTVTGSIDLWISQSEQLLVSVVLHTPRVEGSFPKSLPVLMGAQQPYDSHMSFHYNAPSPWAAFFNFFLIFGQLSLISQLCHTFKVHNSVVFRIFTRLYNYHRNQFYNFPSPQKESLYLLAVIPYSPSNPPSPRLPAYKKRKHPGKQRRSSLVNAVAESVRRKRKTWWRRWHVSWAWRCCPPGWVLTQCRNNAKYTKL